MLVRKVLSNRGAHFLWRGIVTSSQNTAKKSSSPLAELRKKSGYSLSLCKQALTSCNDDVTQAHQWLDVSSCASNLLKMMLLITLFEKSNFCPKIQF